LANILLTEDYLPGQEEDLKALKYSGDHLLGLVNDLLDFNRIRSGKITILEKEFNLNSFLEDLQTYFSVEAEKKVLSLS